MSQRRFRPHPKVLLTELPDGTGVLLHLDTKFYFTLNRTGVALWKTLEHSPATEEAIVAALAARFDAPDGRIREDVATLLEDLGGESLLEEV